MNEVIVICSTFISYLYELREKNVNEIHLQNCISPKNISQEWNNVFETILLVVTQLCKCLNVFALQSFIRQYVPLFMELSTTACLYFSQLVFLILCLPLSLVLFKLLLNLSLSLSLSLCCSFSMAHQFTHDWI